MVTRALHGLWHSPRVWTLAAAVLTRGVGFVASFSLSRIAGAERLALYMALVVTAASIVAPFAQIFFNGATVALADGSHQVHQGRFMRAQTGVVLSLAFVLMLVFGLLYGAEARQAMAMFGLSPVWLVVLGASLVLAPLLQALLTGGLTGLGHQTSAARAVALCCGALLPWSYPMVWWVGLQGAWGVLLGTLWLPVLCLWLMWRTRASRSTGGATTMVEVSPLVRRLFIEGLPGAAALLVSGGLVWLCMIKLPQMYWGAGAVAVLAISTQWLNLTLLPATTWSAIATADFAQARGQANRQAALRAELKRWLVRNVGVTALVAIGVLAAMHWIESAYRMQDNTLRAVFVWSAIAALFMAAYGVLERLMMVLGVQHYLLWVALLGGLVQVALAIWWAPLALSGLLGATVVGAAVVMLVGGWLSWHLLRREK